jgi:nicotinamide-nucleotide amidase
MQAEIISIGDELTSGQRLDTNSQWLSTRLGEIGVPVLYHTTVADNLEANVEVFRHAAQRADIVISTGGLGPTADDLTRDALAAVANAELVLNETALAYIESLFARRKRPMPERNRLQAMFPRGSRAIHNPTGTAPGIDMEMARLGKAPARIFALPGVPAEMREMWEQTVAAVISAMVGKPRVIRHRQIKCFGVGESDLEQMLPDLIRRGREPQVGITVHGATITLRITAAGDTANDCYRAMEPTITTIRECLGDLVFGEGDDELQDAVLRLLTEQNKTVATAESGTDGVIAHWLSTPSGNAKQFRGGLVASRPVAIASLLRISPNADMSEMAQTCRELLAADYGLAIALPTEEANSEAMQFSYAIAGPRGVSTKSSPYVGHPEVLKTRAAKQALNFLRLTLLRERRSVPNS